MPSDDNTYASRRTVLAVLGAAMLPACRRGWTPPELDPTSRSQVKPYVRGAEMFDTFEEHWVNTTCAQCPAACAVRVRVVEGRAVRIEANAKSPVSCGGMCVPGLAGLHTLYDPDRITQPLRRVRGRLEPISWDAAIAELAGALATTRSRGPERLLVLSGLERGFRHELLGRFCRTFGSPNFVDGSPSHGATLALAMERTLGVRELPAYRWEGAGAILSLETALFEDAYQSVHFARAVAAMRRDRIGGARLVHAGPAFDLAAYNADRWLRIQPGTSGALALGIAHVLLRDGTYDHAIDGAPGIAAFRALAASFPPERVASVAGCDPGALERTARELWTRRPVLVVVDERSLAFSNGLDTASIAIALSALLGSLEVDLGGMRVAPQVPTAAWAEPELDAIATAGLATPRLDGAGAGPFQGARSVLETLPSAIDKAPPEIALVFQTNPAFARAQPDRWRAALGRVPLVVSFSPFLDETTRETAHLVLPDHTYLERFEDGTPAPGSPRAIAGVRRPVVTPLYDTRSTAEVVIELAKKLGFAHSFPWPSATAAFEERWLGLQATGRGTIHTDDSRAFLDHLYEAGFWAESDDAPATTRILQPPSTWTEPRWDGDPDRFPLRLVPYEPLGHGEGSSNEPWQRNLYPRPGLAPWQFAASISPTDAPRGIRTGDKIRVISPHGELVVTAHLDAQLAPGCIAIPTGGGHRGSGRWADGFGVNVMELVAPTAINDTGASASCTTRVRVEVAT